ncbi:ubiquitin binding protein [Agrocybe pediades]|nr:ubiquitin binding protein [Agrocybe pediades]
MSGLGAWIWGTSQLDDAIDKATSELLPAGGEDIALNLEICDQIRSKSAPAKDAMRALKRRLNHKNPNVQLLALSLTDICIKNGGDLFLSEVASREFMDNLVSILKMPGLNHDVKEMILRMVQNWSIALEGKPTLSYIGQVYKTLLSEGYRFPPKDMAVANSAMVDTMTAPEWIDSEVCLRCRTAFSFTNRKHHCRNCGQVFDQACSSKSMPLPHFGITQDVRVCDGCYNKLTKKAEKADKDKGHRHSSSHHGHRHKSARELADAELQRAIELSLQEVNGTSRARSGYVPSQPSPSKWAYSEPPIVDRSTYPSDRKTAVVDDDDDPDLKAAIEASLREANAPKPSAPVVLETPRAEEAPHPYGGTGYSQSYTPVPALPALPKIPNYDLEPLEADAILTFNQTVEQVQAQGGKDLSRYPAVTELYDKANGLRPKLALSLDDAGRKEQMLTEMHEQLSQAVKLYDQILSQQVSQPRWRQSTMPPTVQQPPQQAFSPTYAPNGYNQWAPQQSSYQAQVDQQRESVSPRMYASPPPIQPQQTGQQYYSQALPQQQPQYAQHQPSPVSLPVQQSPQYAQPPSAQSQYQPFSTPATYNPVASSSIQAPPPPISILAQSPPPTASHYQAQASTPIPVPVQPNQPSLQRHNSAVAYSPPSTSNLARSNTVPSQPPAQYQQQQQPQQPQQQYQPQQYQQPQQVPHAPSAPPAPLHQVQPQLPHFPSVPAEPAAPLPQFPAVPSGAPHPAASSAYSTGYGFEQKEEMRKEALLIDL